MTTAHRFAVGQRVYVERSIAGTASGAYRIVRQMPPEGDENLYRIKNDAETHERVARESQLTRAS